MWDYSFAIPSLFIIALLVVFYFSLPRISLRANRVFVQLLLVEIAVIVTDIIGSLLTERPESPEVLSELFNALYFLCFFLRAYILYMFTASIYNQRTEYHYVTWICRGLLGLCAILALTSPVTGLIFGIDDLGYYSGPLYNILYVVSYAYLVLSFATMIVYRKNVHKRRLRLIMLLYNLVILVGLVVRYLFPSYLLMDTFCLMAILIAYLAFGNPEFYLEPRGNIFNSIAFRDYIEENNGRLSFKALGVVIRNYNEMRDIYGGRQADAGLTLISDYLTETFDKCYVFYYKRGRYIILGDKNMDIDRTIEKLKKRFYYPWTTNNTELYLEASFAVLDVGERVSSADVLLNSIIDGLNRAERRGSAEIITISERELKTNEKDVAIKKYLDTAVEKDAVEVYLQPLMEAGTGKLVGAEALCRIRDEDGNIIPPDKFIPLAEENGKINDLGEKVFDKTCKFIKEYEPQKKGMNWINMNLSPVQFMKADLADKCDEYIKMYGVDPSLIHLEITEESMIDDLFLQKQVHAIKEKGFQFVLDDFGTGYSNLTRLKKCPFSNVKLDMSLVWDYYKEPDSILPIMIQAFKQMGFSVTAEGIEDEKMAEAMREIGCDYFQGYYYSKPISMIDFVDKYLS